MWKVEWSFETGGENEVMTNVLLLAISFEVGIHTLGEKIHIPTTLTSINKRDPNQLRGRKRKRVKSEFVHMMQMPPQNLQTGKTTLTINYVWKNRP